MSEDLSNYSTEELIRLARGTAESSHGLSYKATEQAIGRWREGVDLEDLVKLIESEKSDDRIAGAYYLNEVSKDFVILKIAAIKLSRDALSTCRRAFVLYITTSGYYDEELAELLVKCLLDLDLYVRVSTIKWAMSSSQEVFLDFSKRVESGTGRPGPKFSNPLSNDFWNSSNRNRALRGIEIARRFRLGEEIGVIRKSVIGEDSFIFDSIEFSNTTRERYARWKK